MPARWASFAVGLWLILAPLVLGYASLGAILHDVALGTLVCILVLGALDWPAFRFALLLPAAWLLWTAHGDASAAAAGAEGISGALLAVLAPFPNARRPARPVPMRAPGEEQARA